VHARVSGRPRRVVPRRRYTEVRRRRRRVDGEGSEPRLGGFRRPRERSRRRAAVLRLGHAGAHLGDSEVDGESDTGTEPPVRG
jgi:hypothetical protein